MLLFTAKIKTGRRAKDGRKTYRALLIGKNNEVVFTGEPRFNKKPLEAMLQKFFPGIEIVP